MLHKLPPSIEELSQILQSFPGVGKRSAQKLTLDILDLSDDDFNDLMRKLDKTKQQVKFCQDCGFFSEDNKCEICKDKHRKVNRICLVEKATDVLTIEKSEIYRGLYHVLQNLISPLDNIFAEDTTINKLIEKIEKNINTEETQIEIILFLKPGFAAEATIAYIKEILESKKWSENIKLTKPAQGLPLHYNPETLDQATVIKALEDRRTI